MYSKELLKGTLKPLILKILSQKEAMYGYEIVQQVKQVTGGQILIREGSLYPKAVFWNGYTRLCRPCRMNWVVRYVSISRFVKRPPSSKVGVYGYCNSQAGLS